MDVSSWFFESWPTLLKTVVVGFSCYFSLIILLRMSGKRTLSKMNMFDFVVTVAFGSTMAAALTSDSVSYAQCVVAFATLIGAQFMVTWLAVRSKTFEDIIKADPTLLFFRGRFIEKAMRRERVPREEILSAMRSNGQGSPEEVDAVMLESSGELVVLAKVKSDQTATLESAGNWEDVSK